MNQVTLIGRLTKDPDVRYSSGENVKAVSRFTLAVDKPNKNKIPDGQPTADFINCVAFGGQGEFAEKYLKKGTMIIVNGRIQTGSYTNKDGVKVYTTDVAVSGFEFVPGQKKAEEGNGNNQPAASDSSDSAEFMNLPDDEELPFN